MVFASASWAERRAWAITMTLAVGRSKGSTGCPASSSMQAGRVAFTKAVCFTEVEDILDGGGGGGVVDVETLRML